MSDHNATPLFKRALRKHIACYAFFACVLLLNIATPMSFVNRYSHHMPMNMGVEVFQFLFVLFIDAYMLPSLLFEINSLAIGENGLEIGALLWRTRVPYEDVVSFKVPTMLTWAILRTKRCFYLINRRDIPKFQELMVLLGARLPSSKL